MRHHSSALCLFSLLLILNASCEPQTEENGEARARAAAERVTPELEPELEKQSLRIGDRVFLRAFKEEGQLEVWMQPEGAEEFVLFRSYPIAAQSGNLGPKEAEGDFQVPEGFYAFGERHLNPRSSYHLSFNIGYPNEYDRFHDRTGSYIMVHGSRVSIGCLAMTDPVIEEIYTLCSAALQAGQPFIRIHLFPFRLEPDELNEFRDKEWYGFWLNLEEGYRNFEENRVPPNTTVRDGQYQFAPE
ncbi:MAG: murein L,D-transpeptidase family protein [Verrucomicrobiota bacterium]